MDNKTNSVEKMDIYKALSNVQSELKAPKGQHNSFGNYNYRSAEDILEAVKPLLKKYELTLITNDEIVQRGDRYYVKATATVFGYGDDISATGYARESLTKKGMDDSQITGATSSYARKYAYNGLFAIDDTKDADTDDYAKRTNNHSNQNTVNNSSEASPKQLDYIRSLAKTSGMSDKDIEEKIVKIVTSSQASAAIKKLQGEK